MKGQQLLKSAMIIILVKHTIAAKPKQKPNYNQKDLPLSRSFGVSKPKLGKSLDDHRLGQEYMEQYQEMMKSQESFESFDERDEKRLRRVIGDDDFGLMADAGAGSPPRRRSAPKLRSPAGKRRARSQAIRRHKLNSQGLRSHMIHSKQTNLDYPDYN